MKPPFWFVAAIVLGIVAGLLANFFGLHIHWSLDR